METTEQEFKLWNGYEKSRGESDVKTWIYRVSLNCCLNQQKKRRREPDHIALTMDIDPFEGTSDRSLQTKRLYDRINHLGLIDKAIILLWLEGMSYEEIGAIIGISVKNVSFICRPFQIYCDTGNIRPGLDLCLYPVLQKI